MATILFDRDLYTAYQTVLDSIPAQIYLTVDELNYHQAYKDFYNQVKLWKLDSVPLPILDSAQVTWLNEFADEHSVIPTYGYALLAINDTSFHLKDPVYIPDTSIYLPPLPKRTNNIKKTELKNKVVIYPNPTDRIITVEWMDNTLPSSLKIHIIDQFGRKVLIKEWNSKQNFVNIDISALKSRVYYCTLLKDNLIVETQKVILAK